MYQKNFSNRSRFSGNRPGSRPGNHSGSHSGGRPQFRPSNKRKFGTGQYIDPSKFVNKAVAQQTSAPFVPTHRFADFVLDQRVKANIIKKGYVNPTPIQDGSIPQILNGQDIVGIANTGTGKTAAFLIPLINKVLTKSGERVLVMVPTRELAQQIDQELREFAVGLQIYGTVCVGGVSIGGQISSLRRKPQFVIGTPGRLKDLLERKSLYLNDFGTVVLDEADRMLDMGFVNDMRQILSLLRADRQTLFFSATISHEIEKLISEFLRTPARVSVKTSETAQSIEQDVVRVPSGKPKFEVLCDLLIEPGFDKVLIFGRTKHGVERLSKQLEERGFKSESIHGNKTQSRRQKALDLFKRDHVQALVATDVAARGLDINGVSHVINYDLPGTYADYVHRIGRTGRAGAMGKALTFIE